MISLVSSPSNLPRKLNHAILRIITQNKGPIGQGTLNLKMRKDGYSVSAPTIGRRLQELEFDGLLRKVSVDGRVITERGRTILKRWDKEDRLRMSGDALLETLKRGDKKHILDLLSARRVIERETAALAAQHASPKAIRRLEELLGQQARSVKAGQLGLQEDVSLHREIARASGSAMLYSLVSLLRNHERYDVIITSMRTLVGSSLVEDHKAILKGIKARDSQKARDAMDGHLRKLMDDIDRYWQRWMRGNTRAKK